MAEFQVEYLDGEQETAGFITRAGSVKITYPNGDVFTGQVDDRKLKHGQGKYEFAGGEDDEDEAKNVYEGAFTDGSRTGVGKMTYKDGTVYRGEFITGFRHGRGSYTYVNKDMYSGEWKDDKRHGKGTYLFHDSKCHLEAEWVDGEPVQGKFVHPDGTTFSGSFQKGKYHAASTFSFSSGLCISGEFYSIHETQDKKPVIKWKATSKVEAAC